IPSTYFTALSYIEMNKAIVTSLLFWAFLISMSSCRTFKEPEFRSIENIRLRELSVTDTLLSLDMTYFNQNNSTIKLKKAEGKGFLYFHRPFNHQQEFNLMEMLKQNF